MPSNSRHERLVMNTRLDRQSQCAQNYVLIHFLFKQKNFQEPAQLSPFSSACCPLFILVHLPRLKPELCG